MLDITYDPEADAAHIHLGGGRIVESEEVAAGIIVDYDREGRVVGIELLHASKRLAPAVRANARRPGEDRPPLLSLPLDPSERAAMIAEAQKASRLLRDDPTDRAILDEIESIQAENALTD
jgi:uncharacterized protein YuzE